MQEELAKHQTTSQNLRSVNRIVLSIHKSSFLKGEARFQESSFASLPSQVDSGEFIRCKEMVDEYLRSLELSLPANAVYIFDGVHIQNKERGRSSVRRLRQARRGRHSGEQGDCDEYYDGFRRLYDMDAVAAEEGGDVAGLQNNVSPCPPLHPAVN